jgi:protein transport protein SEC24
LAAPARHLPPAHAQAHAIIRSLGSQRGGHYPRVQIASADDGRDLRFLAMLTEDRSQAAMSYVEFLCHIHRQIQNKLN